MAPPWRVGFVDAASTVPLRRSVLRHGRPAAESSYPGDGDPRSRHVAAWPADGAAPVEGILAVGSVLPESPPWDPEPTPAWRIRGMAVAEDRRGGGAGTAVLDALLAHVAASGGGLVWCSARVPAVPLYERAGFERRGEVFEAPYIGPHRHLWRMVSAPEECANLDA
jgi:GNAT superfamily N-acetyltransferase